ncbi:uncharacterized protein ISCGN_002635 [Ixodes scapularis]
MQHDVHVPINDGLEPSLFRPSPPPMPPPVVVVATAAVHYLPGTLSPHTQAKTNLRSGATVDARVQKPLGETGDKQPRPGPMAPQAPNDEPLSQEEPYEEEEDRLCFYVWGISSVTFITIIIPMGLFVLSHPTVHPIVHSTVHPTPGTQTSQPRATPNSTAGLSELPDPQLCAMPLLSDWSPALPPSHQDRPQFQGTTPRPAFRFRDVLCVLDIKYHIKRPPYSPIYLPLPYCSKLIASSFAVVDDRLVAKRGRLDAAYLKELVDMNKAGWLVRGTQEVPIYMNLGGDRADSANISKALRDPASRKRLAAFVVNYTDSHIINCEVVAAVHDRRRPAQGVHLDWDHPGAHCGDPNDAANLKDFIADLQAMKMSNVMLSVPPSPDLVDLYNLNQIMDMLKLVIVKTHTLRPDNTLACTGDRADAFAAFAAIRANLSGIYRDKLAYSIQVQS